MNISRPAMLVSLPLAVAAVALLALPLPSPGGPITDRARGVGAREMDDIMDNAWRFTPSSRAYDPGDYSPVNPPKFKAPKLPIPYPFKFDPAMVFYRRGKQLFRQGRFAEAREQFLQALKLNPLKGECYSFLGQIYLEQDKNYSLAIAHLRKAITCCSPSTRYISLYYLALAYEGIANNEVALRTWEEYFRTCPPGTTWEADAKKHYAALKPVPAPAPTP